MDCSANQFSVDGKCLPCQQCGPGQELSEDCGYSSGEEALCVNCRPRWYKDDWGHHGCKVCQSCKLVNRHQTSNCTGSSNAVCGECLPGFFSKTRIDGLRDLECMPCALSSASEPQCTRSRGIDVVRVWSSEATPQDATIPAAVCAALGTVLIALVMLSVVYCRRTFIRNFVQGCLRSQSAVRREAGESDATTETRITLSPTIQDKVRVTGPSHPFTAEDTSPTSLRSYIQACSFAGTMTMSPDLKPPFLRSSSETQPLMRDLPCGHCSSACSSQRSSSSGHSAEYPSEMSSTQWESKQDKGPANLYCASDQRTCLQHTPVECTEMDFQSCEALQESPVLVPAEMEGCSVDNRSAEQSSRASDRPDLDTDGCERTSDQFGTDSINCSEMVSKVQSLVKTSCDVTQGVHLGRVPKAVVEALSLKLDPSFPGVKNFRQVGLELRVPGQVLDSMRGFEHVFNYLSCSTLSTVPDLLNTFHRLQRFDALFLLCEYATQRRFSVCTH
ncbi:tumor necrosis factor receptor superfamily member 27 isoform X2 [Amia ocellicauda]